MPVVAKAMQGEVVKWIRYRDIYLKIETSCRFGVPMKILAHPNDAVGKVYGVEHCHVNVGSSSSMSHQRVRDLEKHVETLKEKGYKETKNQLEATK
ncbi:hypothetical protein H5410_000858 [Solanum commersonii]|uniref:Uncharacterized protein n=1 Tax=Solanum commersonii TaxID=4109 RepID=A0A9J6AX10_SOLCO|nr:hypothetical protein H5410_000858 [Solanum commersonii]